MKRTILIILLFAVLFTALVYFWLTRLPTLEEPVIDSATGAELLTARLGREAVSVHDLWIKPLEVVEDSRCPETLECFWAGTLKLKTSVIARSTEEILFELGKEQNHEGLAITLMEVTPPTPGERLIKNPDYRFVFRIEKR